MGDLIISFICPNGQSIIVHQQGGGGTDLGIPVTGDEANPIAGTGFDYWWSPTATNGTWAQASAGVNTLPSGTYSSVQPWSNLIGCPLNGTWTIEICDIFAIDNGHVFDWAVIFAPELYPELITFTPTFGADCDSTFWSGEGITSANENCNNITVEPTDLGTWIYTYNATNNHGCTYTVDVEVEVVQGPIASAPELAYYCNDQAILQGSVSNPQPGQLYAYSWSPDAFLNNPSSSSPVVNNLTEPTTFTLTVFPAGAPECASSTDVLVDIPPPPVPLVTDEVLEACFGTTLTIASPNQPEGWNYFFEWTNIDEPENVLWDGQNYSAASPGTYQLVVTMVEPCMYSASGVVEVEFESCELGPIPNIFSPNNDGINDSFAIEGLERFSDVRFVVYNRWGTLVFESENYRNNWRPSPDELSDGTYFFVLTVPFPTKPEPEVYTGTLQVVRTTRP